MYRKLWKFWRIYSQSLNNVDDVQGKGFCGRLQLGELFRIERVRVDEILKVIEEIF